MRILMIGGSGFFGKSLLHLLQRVESVLRPGSEVILASRHPDPMISTGVEYYGVKVSSLFYDVLSGADLPDCDVLIHAAASSDATRYVVAPEAEAQTIVQGTCRVLDLMKRMGQAPRLIYLSSGAVYGRQPKSSKAISEDSAFEIGLDPAKGAYALAKRDAECAVVRYALTYDRPTIIARCFAFVGAFLPTTTHFAIGNMIGDIEARRPISIRAQHAVYRSYLSADNLWFCLLKMVLANDFRGEVFNVGSEHAIEIHELGMQLGARFGIGYSGLSLQALKSEHSDYYIPDMTKSRNTFNLSEAADLGDIISDILEQRARLAIKGQ